MGWQDDPVVGQANAQPAWASDPIVGEQKTDPYRVAALGSRAVGEGVAGALLGTAEQFGKAITGGNVTDVLDRQVMGKTLSQLQIADFNQRFGTNIPEVNSITELLSALMTKAGAPVPETPTERIGSAAVRGASGALAFPGAAASPFMAAASGASGGASGEAVKEAGGGPLLQTAASIAGGLAPYALTEGVKAIGRGASALVEPMFGSGREKIVGRALNEAATDPQAAQARMADAAEIVPGSKPTAAQVSQDYGIISTERAAKATNPAPFAERASEQNTARQEFLGVAAKDQKALDNLVTRRDEVTSGIRDQAFQQAQGKTVDAADIAQKIDDLIANPDNAGETSQKALQWAKTQLEGKTDPRAIYAVRKDIANKIAGKVESEQSVLRYAGGELRKVNGIIDDAIQEIAPAWKGYLIKYRQLSKPIDRMSALQEAQGKSTLGTVDATTQLPVFSPAKWRQQVNKLVAEGELTQGQEQRVQRIADDLQRGAALNDPNIRAIGSNTTQDMTAANVLGQALGSTKMTPLVRTLMRPLQWVYKIPEAELQSKLAEALLDPKLGAALMQKASSSSMDRISALLRQRFVAAGAGTGAAVVTQQLRPQEQKKEPGQ